MRYSINLTDFCNLNCEWCYALCDITKSNNFMKIEDVENFVKIIVSHETNMNNVILSLAGGEPLLHENIIDIVSYLKKYISNTIFIYTNGVGKIVNNNINKLKNHF